MLAAASERHTAISVGLGGQGHGFEQQALAHVQDKDAVWIDVVVDQRREGVTLSKREMCTLSRWS